MNKKIQENKYKILKLLHIFIISIILLVVCGISYVSLGVSGQELLSPTIAVSKSNEGFKTDIANKEYYYHDKATVTINVKATNYIEGIGLKIEVLGANKIETNIYMVKSKEIEVTKAGKSIIRAWTIDKEGNQSNELEEIIINIDNTKPENTGINLEITRGTSPLSNGWYNSEEVEITIQNNIDSSQMTDYKIIYGTRPKGKNIIPNNLREMTKKQENVIIIEEGITELVAYVENHSGVKSDIKVLDIQIDRTPPTVGELVYSKVGKNEIKMFAKNTLDTENGAGISEYLFCANDDDGKQKIIRSSIPQANLVDVQDKSLVSVIAVDKGGNYASETVPIGETNFPTLYTYDVFRETSSADNSLINTDIGYEINIILPIRNSTTLVCYASGGIACMADPGHNNSTFYSYNCLSNTPYFVIHDPRNTVLSLEPGTSFVVTENIMSLPITPTYEVCHKMPPNCIFHTNKVNDWESLYNLEFCCWSGENFSCGVRSL